MSYFSYACAVKGRQMKFKEQKLHIAIRNKMRQTLPEEIISLIFTYVYRMAKGYHLYQIDRRFGTKSIWWDPSDTLKRMCGERGGIQLGYYDIWSLFRSFIPYRENKICIPIHPELHLRNHNYEEEYIERCFNEDRCGRFQWGCLNCIGYNFPCTNLLREDSDSGIEFLWNIKDEPFLREFI